MSVRIRPEPSDEERAVLLQALAALDAEQDGSSSWWQAGAREAVEDGLEGEESY